MFKKMLKTLIEETGDNHSQILAVNLVTEALFAQHEIGSLKTEESMEFVESHCSELYLVQTDIGFCLIDFDGGCKEPYQLVIPATCRGSAADALLFIHETALEEEADEIEKPSCKLVGTDGNVFSIIGLVSKTLQRAKQPERAAEFQKKAMSAGSYDAVLAMVHDYVEVE